jgi:ankyrin repeat protein
MGVRPNRNNVFQESFKLAARDSNPERIAKLFGSMFAHGANPNSRADDTRETPLHLGIELGGQRAALVVPLLLRAGANPDVPDRNGDTAVHRLIEKMGANKDHSQKNRSDVLDAMLKKSRRALSARNSLGWTPMHLAAFIAIETAVLERLLSPRGLEDRDREGNTVLHLACSPQRETRSVLSNIQLLIKEGADVNARDRRRSTPLHRVLRSNVISKPRPITLALGNAGADPTVKDRTGKAPIDLVLNNKHFDVNTAKNNDGPNWSNNNY